MFELCNVFTESSSGDDSVGVVGGGEVEEGEDVEPDDDQAEFHAADDQTTHPAVQPRWPTRVFAAECVQRIIVACEGNKSAHFDLALAKEMQLTKSRGMMMLQFNIITHLWGFAHNNCRAAALTDVFTKM